MFKFKQTKEDEKTILSFITMEEAMEVSKALDKIGIVNQFVGDDMHLSINSNDKDDALAMLEDVFDYHDSMEYDEDEIIGEVD